MRTQHSRLGKERITAAFTVAAEYKSEKVIHQKEGKEMMVKVRQCEKT